MSCERECRLCSCAEDLSKGLRQVKVNVWKRLDFDGKVRLSIFSGPEYLHLIAVHSAVTSENGLLVVPKLAWQKFRGVSDK